MKRKKNILRDGLLPRMEAIPRKKGISYRYHPVGAKPISLGMDKVAAIRKVLDIIGAAGDTGTIGKLWEEFQETDRWKRYAPDTRKDYEQCAGPLLLRFKDARASDIEAPDVARYLRKERKDAPVRANREIALLSNLIGLAIEFGQAKTNPCREVRRNEEQPRTETADPADFKAFTDWLAAQGGQRAMVGMAAEYAALAGNRKIEFLDLSWPQVDRKAGHIRVKRTKQRGKKRGEVIEQIEITPPLAALLDRLEAIRGDRECLYVFTTKFGTHYTRDGFKGFWGKLLNAAIEAKVVERRFTFHDLRAYYATQFKQERGTLPDLHANPATTARVYDRNKIVKRKAL
ncbi:tyrosine-type recombinase/integrase [Burkholderia cepacia]|uniref:tyrosine-type recombinase/integrase n=1 Tax=Burkholderia cepacia TaxID=292 RepID=UPI0007530CD7|nr:tyrosine-type recombinase/integrase [Burkholderia cepacia]KUY74597.1 integrase [Burkholderia cepacia]KVE78094.1 integrase [Burkholderia cepacia]KVH55551.1 integrase [Burkholderia cepacia]QOH34476.1 phage integrase family protein [Burkholderia cepacia]